MTLPEGYWKTKLPEGQRPVSSYRRGSRFRLAHDPQRAGQVIEHDESGCLVKLDRLVERVFTTKDGEEVKITKKTERVMISNESPVLPYRAKGATS